MLSAKVMASIEDWESATDQAGFRILDPGLSVGEDDVSREQGFRDFGISGVCKVGKATVLDVCHRIRKTGLFI